MLYLRIVTVMKNMNLRVRDASKMSFNELVWPCKLFALTRGAFRGSFSCTLKFDCVDRLTVQELSSMSTRRFIIDLYTGENSEDFMLYPLLRKLRQLNVDS